ncbi:Uncharacterised protein [Mycobacteroides abscessus subsp. abscessus]|uniref:hypothetical protein n=1 Tax=Mycobacteroides abscessus TaxID=36809 RepID=UPI0009295A6E|nr:hypothetical protein [Mycobacteroides abscessus]SHU65925.1 Uncharacterised protein [Mycobacteroides abscessus subsp. abscessus]
MDQGQEGLSRLQVANRVAEIVQQFAAAPAATYANAPAAEHSIRQLSAKAESNSIDGHVLCGALDRRSLLDDYLRILRADQAAAFCDATRDELGDDALAEIIGHSYHSQQHAHSGEPATEWNRRQTEGLKRAIISQAHEWLHAIRAAGLIVSASAADLPTPSPLRDDRPRIVELLRVELEQLWDEGNATGLDGWIGPGRGAAGTDPEAVDQREKNVNRALDRIIEQLYGK